MGSKAESKVLVAEEGTYQKLFRFFYVLMEGKMGQHMAEEGDMWLEEDHVPLKDGEVITMEEHLDNLLFAGVEEYRKERDLLQLEDVANLCAIRRIRSLLKPR